MIVNIILSISCKKIFDFIVTYKRNHDGNSPTGREIMDACNISSTSMVDFYLNELAKKGKIERLGGKGASRNIRVVGGSWTFPA